MCESIRIDIDSETKVSGLLKVPPEPQACYVMAHGSGAGMTHVFLQDISEGLRSSGIATLRFQFPYMELGLKRPDRPPVAHAAVRAAVAEAARLLPAVPLFAGGKSFGGRMTSQAQAAEPMPGVRGLVFLGFPLHPAGKPSNERGKHLFGIQVPMLFLQGTRDALAEAGLVQSLAADLGRRASLRFFQHADHSFHVPAKSGKKDAEVQSELMDAISSWIKSLL